MPVRPIRRVLTNLRFTDAHWSRLLPALAGSDVQRVEPGDAAALQAGLDGTDVAFLDTGVVAQDLTREGLAWVHIDHAGLDRFATEQVLSSSVIVTGSAGRSAPVLAEHALMFMLALASQLPRFMQAQARGQWGIPGQDDLRGLYGRTVGIIGLGSTGRELALRCKAMGMTTLGHRRCARPVPHIDRLFATDNGDTIAALLALSDFVVLCTPLTDQTYHLIGAPELAGMKAGAVLVNIARGAVVDEAALVQALHDGVIAGAGLDVFEREPLPTDAPIWRAPNTIITPHCTPQVPDRLGRSLDIILDNIRRFKAGEPLVNQLTADDALTLPAR